MALQHTKYDRWLFICLLSLLLHADTFAQNIFHAIILNKMDSSIIPYAAVTDKETGRSVLTDANGAFQFVLAENTSKIKLTITAIGIKTAVTYIAPFRKTQMIYVDVVANTLSDFSLKGLSAEEVVKTAVASITDNYVASSYFNYSFYRRYQKMNGLYINLFEACPIVMFHLSKSGHLISAAEAFAVTQLRRSNFHSDFMNVREDNPVDLLVENPIYHLESSSLNPSKYPDYQFFFDTANKSTEDYVIKYVSNKFSSDDHGIYFIAQLNLKGESYETGTLIIDRATFAIKTIRRKSFRRQDFSYYFKNNMAEFENHKYEFEFVSGDLEADYELNKGKWYLKKIFRQYTNDIIQPIFENKIWTITDNFEWYGGPISRYTTQKYVDNFYSKMATAIYSYDTAFWETDSFPFHYAEPDAMYENLKREGPLEKQFTDEAKIDEYPAKPGKK